MPPNCPDCNTPMKLIEETWDEIEQEMIIECEPYYKCPNCKIEVENE